MTRWREITFYVDKPDSAGTGPENAGTNQGWLKNFS